MKWQKDDLKKYLSAKEYIDTILIPLVPIHFSSDNKLAKDAFQKEVMQIFALEIEKELSGRVLLAPNYTYINSIDKEEEARRLNQWIDDAKKQPFKTFIFLTFDGTWKKVEQSINGTLLWLPGINSGDLKSEEMVAIIRNQVEQISELIRSYW